MMGISVSCSQSLFRGRTVEVAFKSTSLAAEPSTLPVKGTRLCWTSIHRVFVLFLGGSTCALLTSWVNCWWTRGNSSIFISKLVFPCEFYDSLNDFPYFIILILHWKFMNQFSTSFYFFEFPLSMMGDLAKCPVLTMGSWVPCLTDSLLIGTPFNN